MITPADITGVDEGTARLVLLVARSIAPCIVDLDKDTDDGKNAIAVLQAVAAETRGRGSRMVASQSIGPARVSYRDVESCFSGDHRTALRTLCGATVSSGHPVGYFPSGRVVAGVWPEEKYEG